VLGGGSTFSEAAFRTAITTALAGPTALDPAGTNISNFNVGLDGNIDPRIPINDLFAIKTTAYLKYNLSFGGDTETGVRSIEYSEANAVSTTNSKYSFSETAQFANNDITHDIKMKLGGLLEFHDNAFLTIDTGFFYCPEFYFQTTAHADSIIERNYSWQDQTNAAALATAANTSASDIDPANNVQGSSTYTSTTTYGGDDAYTFIQHRFYIPFSARLDLMKDTLSLIGGYIIVHTQSVTYSKSAGSSTYAHYTVYASFDLTGTPVYETPDSLPPISVVQEYTNTSTSGEWTGTMSFILRFTPAPSMTFDVYGRTLMNALNFDIIGTGAGFNPSDFIGSLGISATFHIK
jgi:hypothetical protein